MTSQTLLFRVALVVIVVLVGYITIPPLLTREEPVVDDVDSNIKEVEMSVDENETDAITQEIVDDMRRDNEMETDDSSKEDSGPDPVETSVVTKPDPIPEPIETPVKPLGYTSAEVAVHNSETSCWSIIDGNVYDLTSFIGEHPGGERNILKICGKDGTSAFMGQHGGESKPEKTLAGFLIGPLTN